MSYAYAKARMRSGLTLTRPNGPAWTQTYDYDSSHRLQTLTSTAGAFSYSYVANQGDLVGTLTLPSGAYIENVYTNEARLMSTSLKNSATALLNRHAYEYNGTGLRSKQTRTAGDYVSYGYDSLARLFTASGKESGGATNRYNEQFTYWLDAAGNLAERDNDSAIQTFSINPLNQYTNVSRNAYVTASGTTSSGATNVTVSANGGGGSSATLYSDSTFALRFLTLANGNNTITAIAADSVGRHDTNTISLNLPSSISYSYDQNGNLTGDGRRTMLYDDQNQLISIIVTNGVGSSTRSTNIFDGLGRRRIRREFIWQSSAWAQTAEMRYIYDGMLPIQERDGNNIPSVTYTRGIDLSRSLQGAGGIGGLLARTDHSTITPSHAYYHCDGSGNVTSLINERQVVVARYLYEPFGKVMAKSGPLADANTYQFSSKEFHGNSGLIYYGYRFYDPNLQRWLNRDPIGERGGINLYRFNGNSSLDFIDPFGLDGYFIGIGGVVGGLPYGLGPMLGGGINVGVTDGGQPFLQFNGLGGVGLGLYGGVGVSAGRFSSKGKLPFCSSSKSAHGEFDIGLDLSGGIGVDVDPASGDTGVSFSPVPHVGFGIGGMIGGGVSGTTTIAFPAISINDGSYPSSRPPIFRNGPPDITIR